jgi:hypothetical protein
MLSSSPVPRDLVAILVVLFVTYALQFFASTAAVPELLRLGPAVYAGFLWQLVTYPFVGFGGGGLWFLLELLVLFWFGRDVFWRLGRRRFWTLLVAVALLVGVVAVGLQLLVALAGLEGVTSAPLFVLMQGQRTLMAILIAAFATLWGEATVLLFFVLPLKARWFLWLEILFAFMGFLTVKDLAGLVGIAVAVGVTWLWLTPGGARGAGRRLRLRLDRWRLAARLARLRRGRRFDVIEGRKDPDRWVH